jgi:hypothetical protein
MEPLRGSLAHDIPGKTRTSGEARYQLRALLVRFGRRRLTSCAVQAGCTRRFKPQRGFSPKPSVRPPPGGRHAGLAGCPRRSKPQRGFTVREARMWNPGRVRRRGGAFPTQRSPPGGGQHWAMGWNRFAVRWHMTSPGKQGPLAKPGTSCEHYWFVSVDVGSLLVRYRNASEVSSDTSSAFMLPPSAV